MKAIRVMLIGPMPPPIGGTTVLFAQLVRELAGVAGVSVHVINTSRGRGAIHSMRRALIVIYEILRRISETDVISFHTSRQGAALFGPIVAMLGRSFGKPWIFRGFGDYRSWYENKGFLTREIFRRSALRANVALFETQSSVEYFRTRSNGDVRWYPNSRPPAVRGALDNPPAGTNLRFVFIGHVKPSKGIRELIAAAELTRDATVDVYGPLLEGIVEADFAGKRARYRGPLDPGGVAGVLRQYDVLVLPTFYEGEGYPGIILEAYAQGLPVIATRWRALPEIVTEETGILVQPRNAPELAAAMDFLNANREVVASLRRGASSRALLFSSAIWTDYFAQLCRELRFGSDRERADSEHRAG